MVRVQKASLAFKKENASVKTTFGSNVINCLAPAITATKKVQPVFADLPVPVATLQQINDNLVTALANKVNGGRAATQALKTAVADWDTSFTSTANYISVVAAGDAATVLSAGFIPTKSQTQPLPKPGAITNFTATINGTKGTIIAGSKKSVAAAKIFVITAVPPGAQVDYVNDTVIISIGETSVFLTATTRKESEMFNLPSGVPYSVSMFGVNAAGNGPAAPAQVVIPQ